MKRQDLNVIFDRESGRLGNFWRRLRWLLAETAPCAPATLLSVASKMSTTKDLFSASHRSKCCSSSFVMLRKHSSENQYIERKKWHSYSAARLDRLHRMLYGCWFLPQRFHSNWYRGGGWCDRLFRTMRMH